MPDFARSQKSAHNLISRWGKPGALVRAGQRRNCMAAENRFDAKTRALVVEGAVRMFISSYGLSIPPDADLDLLNWDGKWFRFTQPPVGPRPNGLIIFHDCVMLETAAP